MDKNATLKRGYMPQLDSLRAFAVLLVIISHWFAKDYILNRYFDNGVLGVTLFFVLSGFLITGILLKSKNNIENGWSLKHAFKIFYIRRSLRIFPVYYLLLLVLVVFGIGAIRETFWWHFFYASNFFFWIEGHFGGYFSHFWSLSVEEQFYLLWPALIFLLPGKYLQFSFIVGIIIAVVFRYFMKNIQHGIGGILMPGSLDSFCIGGLLAYGGQYKVYWYNEYVKKRKYMVLFSVIFMILINIPFFKRFTGGGNYYLLLISIVFGIWIECVAATVSFKPVSYILNNRILLYIGKISYGIYLFHNFIPFFYGLKFHKALDPFSIYIVQLLRFILLISIASLSWFLFEKPILRLKERFAE